MKTIIIFVLLFSGCSTPMKAMKNCNYSYKKDDEGYHKTDWSVCEQEKILGLF